MINPSLKSIRVKYNYLCIKLMLNAKKNWNIFKRNVVIINSSISLITQLFRALRNLREMERILMKLNPSYCLTMQKIKMLNGEEKKKNAWRVYTSRNRAKAGFAWQVVFIAFLADFQLSRKRVYVSRTTGLVNYKRMKNNINIELKFSLSLDYLYKSSYTKKKI